MSTELLPKVEIDCIVPCHNEVLRLPAVLAVLVELEDLKITCVDDGSTDGTADMVRSQFISVNLLSLPRNQGKAAAVLAGLLQISSDYVMLIDADLQGLNKNDLEAAIRFIQMNPEVDMLIFRRTAELWWARLVRGDDLFSGERIVRTKDLRQVLDGNRVQGYQLEVALNQYMIDEEKVVRRIPVYSKSVLAAEKVGFWVGLKKEINMLRSIISYLGGFKLLGQLLWFPPQVPLPPAQQ